MYDVLIEQLALGIFLDDYDPTREDAYRKHTNINGKYCVVEFLDTNSHEPSPSKWAQWIHESDAAMLVYSISSRQSFNQLEVVWKAIKGVKTQVGMWDPFQLCVVGNKCDLEAERQVSEEEGRAFAKKIGCSFEECSARTSKNVEKVVHDLVRKVKTYRDNERIRYEQLQEETRQEKERR
jgi:GTPase KRas protein